jgi:hypothetical protein
VVESGLTEDAPPRPEELYAFIDENFTTPSSDSDPETTGTLNLMAIQRQKKSQAPMVLLRPVISEAQVDALLDSGASANFISPHAVSKLKLGAWAVDLPVPHRVQVGDGNWITVTRGIRHLPVLLDRDGEVKHLLNFYIFPKLPFDLVLGLS